MRHAALAAKVKGHPWPTKRVLRVLAELSNSHGETVLMFTRIRERTGLRQWGVDKALAELEDAGLVERFDRGQRDGKPLAPGARLKLPGDQPGVYGPKPQPRLL